MEYYTDILGLSLIARDKEAAYLANTVEHHSVILRHGSHPRCLRIGFQLGPDDDLDGFEKQTAAHGIRTMRKKDPEPTIDDMVSFEDTKGTIMEVFRQPEPQHQPFRPNGVVPHKLGHVAFHVTDVKRATRFYCDVLGFRFRTGWETISRSCAAGPTITPSTWSRPARTSISTPHSNCATGRHMQTACDFLSKNGYRILWGPGRHGIGHNLFTYHRSPNGLITELFAELDQMKDEALGYFEPKPCHRDHPQRPKTWPKTPDAANLWGPMPPDEMME